MNGTSEPTVISVAFAFLVVTLPFVFVVWAALKYPGFQLKSLLFVFTLIVLIFGVAAYVAQK